MAACRAATCCVLGVLAAMALLGWIRLEAYPHHGVAAPVGVEDRSRDVKIVRAAEVAVQAGLLPRDGEPSADEPRQGRGAVQVIAVLLFGGLLLVGLLINALALTLYRVHVARKPPIRIGRGSCSVCGRVAR